MLKYLISFILISTPALAQEPLYECRDEQSLYYRSVSINYAAGYIANCMLLIEMFPELERELRIEVIEHCDQIHHQLGMLPPQDPEGFEELIR